MERNEKDSDIAYQNKDIVSKTLGDGMKGKPLAAFGWKTDLTIERLEPTNLPAVEANELRMDNLFVLSDGSIAIIDYESADKAENVLKYLSYVPRVLGRNGLSSGTKLRVMVLYTADVEHAKSDYDVGCLQFHVENAYMVAAKSEEWLEDAKRSVDRQNISFETQMRLIMLPLTYKGEKAKNAAIETCVELASKIQDDHTQNFVLAGLLAFTDKVISEEMRALIERRIRMTKIAASLIESGRQEGLQAGRREGRQEGRREGRQVGQAQSLISGVEAVMKNLSLPLERACEIVGTTVSAYQSAKELLEKTASELPV